MCLDVRDPPHDTRISRRAKGTLAKSVKVGGGGLVCLDVKDPHSIHAFPGVSVSPWRSRPQTAPAGVSVFAAAIRIGQFWPATKTKTKTGVATEEIGVVWGLWRGKCGGGGRCLERARGEGQGARDTGAMDRWSVKTMTPGFTCRS